VEGPFQAGQCGVGHGDFCPHTQICCFWNFLVGEATSTGHTLECEVMVRGEGDISDDLSSRFHCAKKQFHTKVSINREDWQVFVFSVKPSSPADRFLKMESACIDSTEPIFTIISLHFASQPMITRTLWYRCIVPHLETIKLQFQFSADCF